MRKTAIWKVSKLQAIKDNTGQAYTDKLSIFPPIRPYPLLLYLPFSHVPRSLCLSAPEHVPYLCHVHTVEVSALLS